MQTIIFYLFERAECIGLGLSVNSATPKALRSYGSPWTSGQNEWNVCNMRLLLVVACPITFPLVALVRLQSCLLRFLSLWWRGAIWFETSHLSTHEHNAHNWCQTFDSQYHVSESVTGKHAGIVNVSLRQDASKDRWAESAETGKDTCEQFSPRPHSLPKVCCIAETPSELHPRRSDSLLPSEHITVYSMHCTPYPMNERK